ncbi:hypothetical protein HMI56_007298 [Coelomomyces lativittatus]|nr:hypothetical protein HMI56_007298 [Coelomomyces lativittatus]
MSVSSENVHVINKRAIDFLFTDLNIPLSYGDDFMYIPSDLSQCTPCANFTTGFDITFFNKTCQSQVCLNVHAFTGVTNVELLFNNTSLYKLVNNSDNNILITTPVDISRKLPMIFRVFRRPCFAKALTALTPLNTTECTLNETIRSSVCFNVTGNLDQMKLSGDFKVTGDNECSYSTNLVGVNLGCTGSQGIGNQPICQTLNVTFDSTYDDMNGGTTYCYTVNPNGKAIITYFDLNFPNVSDILFPSDTLGTWGFVNNKLRYKFNPVLSSTARKACFILPDKAIDFVDRSIDLQNDVGRVCLLQVKGPGQRININKVCGLDPNVNNAICESCTGSCSKGSPAVITGSQLCRLKTLTTTSYPGYNCTRFSQRPCPTTCPVDCSLDGPNWLQCTADCKSKTVTQTGYFSVVNASANGGTPCGPLTTTQLCTMTPGSTTCPPDVDCTVTGIPSGGCTDVCTKGGPNIMTASFSYPITLTPQTGNGKSCSMFTTVCSCSACVLDSTAFSTASCTATCASNDGSTVTGSQKHVYSVLTPALNAAQCATAIEKPCISRCACDYSTSLPLESCIYTATISATTPWLALGVQKWTGIGNNVACNTVLNVPCQTTLAPTDCVPYYSCLTAQCTPTYGVDYVLSTTLPCDVTTLVTAMNGGKTCNPVPTKTVVSKSCPGCNYNWLCGCQYTTSSAMYGTTSATGTVVCTGTIDANANVPAFCLPTYVSSHATSACETKIVSTACAYSTLGCENTCSPTSTGTATLPWTMYGKNLCTYTDPRPSLQRPAACTPFISSADCSRTIQPVNCVTTNVCMSSRPVCTGTIETDTLLKSLPCRVVTLQEAQFGGFPCPPFSTFKGTAVARCSVSTASPTPTGYFEQANAYNAVFFNGAQCADSSVDGRLAVGGDATLINFSVGTKLSALAMCDQYPSEALRVNGDLTYIGSVQNGNVRASGQCTSGIDTSCALSCNEKDKGVCDAHPFDFQGLRTHLVLLTQSLSTKPTTVLFSPFSGNTLTLTWTGSPIERISVSASNSSPILPWNNYNGLLLQTATVVITVLGDHPILTGFDLSYFLERASYILWVFPEASVVEINAMTVYGSILAPNAELRGTGTIVGQVFAASLSCTDSPSLKIQNAPFKGTL